MNSFEYRRNVGRFLDTLSSEALAYLFPGAEREEIEDAFFGLNEAAETNYYRYLTSSDTSSRRLGGGMTSFMQFLTVKPREPKTEDEYSTDFGNGEVNYLSQVTSAFSRGVDVTDESFPELLPKNIAILKSFVQVAKEQGLPPQDALFEVIENYLKVAKTSGRLRRLHITKNGKIILEGIKDKGIEDVEIKLKPLEKTFYIFYLRHPEGINYKHIIEYKNQLRAIYTNLADRGDNDDIEKRLDGMCNPLDSSGRNGYSSNIYKAFVNVMNDTFAIQYSLVGKKSGNRNARGEDRVIPLNRNYVIDEFVTKFE